MNKKFKTLAFSLIILALISACSTTHKNTQSPRTAIEQLLITEAVTTSLPQQTRNPFKPPLSIPRDTGVFIDTSGISIDKDIVRHAMSRWLGQHGYLVQEDKGKASYRINVIVESLGTEYADTFFGIPPIQGGLIPISTPELAIYKAQYQTGYVKFHFDIFEHPSGRFVQTTTPFLAEKFYNDYTLFFLFGFNKTDLVSPPQLGTIKRKNNNPQTNDSQTDE